LTFTIDYPETSAGKKQWAREYGLNALYSGKHWAKRQKDSQFWHHLVFAELTKQGIPKKPFEKPVAIYFYWDDRLDVDNHAYMGKMIVDALKGWVIVNDNRRWFKGVAHWFNEDNNDGKAILVEIVEV
jgi:hypothetical protein